ncbi:hypothetical protein M9458_054941 [Cirrhinus mrigala]|uniref:Uncharacterized protein n=1 Tax=Cirrhinus mrigala TaxID=683832 RepID=A0ABD0MMA1_CIRMR
MGMAPRYTSCENHVSRIFSPWEDILFLRAGVPLEKVSRHIIVMTDASKTGWGAVCNGHAASKPTDALAHSWPRGLRKYASPPASLIAQTLCKAREDMEQLLLDLVLRAHAPVIESSLVHSSEKDPPPSGEGHNLAPMPRSLEPTSMVTGCDQEDSRDFPPTVVKTHVQARAPSTRRLYNLKWRTFVNWCSSQGKDPRRCGIESVLSFLQGGLDRHLSASTLKIHVAVISTNHDLVEGRSAGKHDLVIRFSEVPGG